MAARLLIHADGDSGGGWSVDALMRRMRPHGRGAPRAAPAPLALQIHDLEGQRVLSIADASPLVDVALAPGTYHVSTERAGRRRRYTVALAPGASFDLHLQAAAGRP